MTCSSARYLLLAGFVGVAASSFSGNDLFGVLAAVMAVLGLIVFERFGRRDPSRRSCPVPGGVDSSGREATPAMNDADSG